MSSNFKYVLYESIGGEVCLLLRAPWLVDMLPMCGKRLPIEIGNFINN